MPMLSRFVLMVTLCACALSLTAQTIHERVVYKVIGTDSFHINIIKPADWKPSGSYPAIVWYFGGGWVSGSPSQFEMQSEYLAARGMVCFMPEYRVTKRNSSTPFQSLMDARSAMRFVRSHAKRYALDLSKIAAGGGSAGGQLAAALEFTTAYNDSTDDLSVSTRPDLLVLFNPVIDNGPDGYGYNRIGDAYTKFSPLHNLHKGAPPVLVLIGSDDKTVPYASAVKFHEALLKLGQHSELETYPGQPHGFFNKEEYKQKTLERVARFLEKFGYVPVL